MAGESYLAEPLPSPDDFELIERAKQIGVNADIVIFADHVHRAVEQGNTPDGGDLRAWHDWFAMQEGVTPHDLDWLEVSVGSWIEPRYSGYHPLVVEEIQHMVSEAVPLRPVIEGT